ncbi:hypothetical protein MNBD_PLANCTO03-393, partial [hydrothermal vent metagenome]
STTINHRIARLDAYEVSLQKAEYSLGRDDLKAAAHHAKAVASSGTAAAHQAAHAEDILRSVEARKAALTPIMRERLAAAVEAMETGDYRQAKRDLNAVNRSGIELSARDRETLIASQEQILLLEVARGERFDSPYAAASIMQPGVVTREDEETQPEEGVDEEWIELPAEVEEVEVMWDEQPATDEADSWDNQPDFLQVARQLEAGSTLAEADIAFAESRWAEARAKYQRALTEFGDVLDADQAARARSRVAEAEIKMGANQGGLIEQVITDNSIAADQKRAQLRTQVEQARRALATGDTNAARDNAAAAKLTWASAKSGQLFPESELADWASQLDNLRADINLEVERNRLVEQARQETDSAAAAQLAALNRERERSRKITEAIDRARALQAEMKYEEALEVVESQILFLDPINPSGLLLRDTFRDILIYRIYNDMTAEKNYGIAYQQSENSRAFLPPKGIINYPTDWPALSTMRAGIESMNETPADRRVLATLENTTLPAQFADNTLEQALNYFAQMTALDMDVDWESLEEIGIDRETTVSLNLKKANARTVLERLLDKVSTDPVTQADWAVTDGMVQIANEDRIRRNTVLEIYDIRDLVFEVPDYDEAPTIDLQSVLQSSRGGGGGRSPFRNTQQQQQGRDDRVPLDERIDQIKEIIYANVDEESWPQGGGTTGAMYDLNGQLLIRNTPKNHREIRSLL